MEIPSHKPALVPARPPSRIRAFAILLIIWVASGIYTGRSMMRSGVLHDDGAIAQSAERVLRGELPHRDFVEIYTGGLSYLHAFAFRVFGVSLRSLRLMLFLSFVAWVPAVYFVARKLVPDWVAGGLTLLAVAWSVPNYTAPMPSWYNLFFATLGVLALFCNVTRPSTWWLFLAGVCGGFSFLAKIVGLYYVAAVLLFLVYLEQNQNFRRNETAKNASPAYSGFVVASLSAFLVLIVALIRAHASAAEIVHFAVPPAVLAGLLMSREWPPMRTPKPGLKTPGISSADRFAVLLKMVVPFLAGVLLPVAVFLIPYQQATALRSFYQGVFVLPAKRVMGAFMHPLQPRLLLPACAVAALILLSSRVGARTRGIVAGSVGVLLLALLLGSFHNAAAYEVLWEIVLGTLPLSVVAGALALFFLRNRPGLLAEKLDEKVMILLSLCALCGLVQFPFAAPIYFCYVAPLAILAAAAILRAIPEPPRALLATLGAAALLFPVLVTRSGGLLALGWHYWPDAQTAAIQLPRAGGLLVSFETQRQYDKAIPLLRQHAQGHPILAGPDCPEVYFLGDFGNPTRSMFEMFEDRAGYRERIEKLVDEQSVKAILLNGSASFSEYYLGPLRSVADEKFPFSQKAGSFEVRWRN